MSRCHWKELEWLIESVEVSSTTNLSVASWMESFSTFENHASDVNMNGRQDEAMGGWYGDVRSLEWNVLYVLWHGEQDVIGCKFRWTLYTRFCHLFGVCRKVRDFVTFKNFCRLILYIFVIAVETVIVIVKVLIRRIDVNILNEDVLVVFVKDALIFEFRNIKNEFRTLFWYFLISWKSRTDRFGSFNGYSRIGWNGCSVFGRSRMTRLRQLRDQIQLNWML